MRNIVPMSELKTYTTLFKKVTQDEPLILTKNGYGKYAILDLEYFDKLLDELKEYKEKAHVFEKAFNSAHDKLEGKDKSISFDEFIKRERWED